MLQELENLMVDVVEKVLPSVVSVTTTKLQRINFYRVAPLQGQGSGVILSENGYIITNSHVVKGAEHLDVVLHDGKSYHAKVVGKSSIRDLAALKIDSNGLSPIDFGDTGSIRVGQFAIAVGNPLGLGTTATFGMISAIDRTIQSRNTYLEGLIQTSAQINPGNSGGALVNTKAELIGIPTAMIPWSQGIGFAIAVDNVRAVYKELNETGTIKTPWMGIVGLAINPRVASYYKLPRAEGVLIVEVPKGPSYTIGLEPGDIITTVNENKIKSMEELRRIIMNQRVGSKIKVSINRNNDVFDAEIELRDAPESG